MAEDSTYHVPVLLHESVDALNIRPDGTYVDVTFGGGGHSREILSRLGPNGRLISFDQDDDALANAIPDTRFTLVHHNFRFLADFLTYMEATPVDGVLGDLGVSSHHFDVSERGFSFRQDGPLDMRMNRHARQTAADIVNTYEPMDLAKILGTWGEVDKPFKIVNAITKTRDQHPIESTAALRNIVESAVGQKDLAKTLAKIFQALRIEVNHEMDALNAMLRGCAKVIRPGGRMVMISYHSLEDRMVKNMMKSGDPQEAQAEQDIIFGTVAVPFSVSQRKPLIPSDDEIARNPRARSAKMRWATRN